ncbi:MAG TPA: ABC transporter substrate-binding protein [Dehalococcoidia bacterium]|nr:ABC transporter substrate-binding protein [Dehalococcoidia bacterium]
MANKWFKRSRAITVSALTLLLLFTLACGSAAAPGTTATDTSASTPSVSTAVPQAMAEAGEAMAEVNPGRLTWLMTGFGNERFDPAYSSSSSHDYGRLIHAHLISSDVVGGRRVITPGILTDWELSSDGLTWTLTVRDGVKWHDGTDLTAEDVYWNLQRLLGPQADTFSQSSKSNAMSKVIDRIELTGPDRVSVTSQAPIPDFPINYSEAESSWFGVILPKRATLHDVAEEEAYDRNPIGAGLMKLTEHIPVDSMTLERFDDYYDEDKRVNFKEMVLRLVPEEATRVAALRAGEADVGPVTLGARNQVEAGNGRLIFGQEGVLFFVRHKGCWNTQFPCSDIRVRQALAYAIDKNLMRDTLYGGPEVMQVKGFWAVTPSTIGYGPELDPYPFDPDKARQLLAEAGYKTPTNPEGKDFGKLVINTWVSISMPVMPESAQLAAEFWKKELGIDVEVRVGDKVALSDADRTTDDLHGQIVWGDDEARLDGSSHLRGSYSNPERRNPAHRDPELFALTQETLAVFDPVEQEKALNATYRRLRDEAYYLSLGYINIPWGVGPRVLSWEPLPLALYPSGLHTITLK